MNGRRSRDTKRCSLGVAVTDRFNVRFRHARWTGNASAALLAGLLLQAAPAHAESADSTARTAAVDLFDAAQALIKKGRFEEACPKLAESYRLDPQLGALLHLADCYEKTGRIASANASFKDAVELAERRGDPRGQLAAERASALEPRLSRLRIDVKGKVPGLEVRRDGLLLAEGSWGLAISVDPGEHTIVASAPGYEGFERKVKVAGEKKSETIEIPLLRKLPEKSEPAGSSTGADPGRVDIGTDNPGGTQRALGWIAGGVGVAGIAVGVVFTVQKSSKLDERANVCPSGIGCPEGSKLRVDDLTGQARSAQTIATIGFIGGGVALAAGAALLLTAPSGHAAPRSGSTFVLPAIGFGHAGIAALHVF